MSNQGDPRNSLRCEFGVSSTESESAVSLTRYPDPACTYELADGSPVVRETNEEFEAVTGIKSGSSLTAAVDDSVTVTGNRPSFEENDRVWLSCDHCENESEYLLRIIAPTEEKPGYLLFTPTGGHSDPQEFGVERMASVLSHDLRNPLDVARARLRAGREDDEDVHFEHVEQAHDRMEKIIQDVLTLARGETVVTPDEEVELGTVASEAWQTVETNEATLIVTGDLPTVLADGDRVSRLFENLFRNSVEHSRDEDLTVSVGPSSDGFYIADDGPGIDAEIRPHVFDPGYSTDEHGTGLGLAIVQEIVTIHGWEIDLHESSEGGARFEIAVPETD